MFLWWNFLFVGEVFGFVWKEEEFIHLLGLVPFLCDVTCTFPLQKIHDLFKDYEIKYCYVDRNKRTGENLKTSMYFSSVRNIMCCVWSHELSELVWCPSVPFCHLLLKPVKVGNFLVLTRSFLVPSALSQEYSLVSVPLGQSWPQLAESLWKTGPEASLGTNHTCLRGKPT